MPFTGDDDDDDDVLEADLEDSYDGVLDITEAWDGADGSEEAITQAAIDALSGSDPVEKLYRRGYRTT